MTAVPARGPVAGASWPVPVVLGAAEARRLVRHPVFLGGLALLMVGAGLARNVQAREAYSMLVTAGTFFLGPVAFFAANLLASRPRRDGAEEWLSALPAARTQRTGGLLLAAVGPVAACLLFLAVLFSVLAWRSSLVHQPPALEMATGPLSVLGGSLLGVMVSRWAPWSGAAALVMVGLVAFHVSLPERLQLLGAYVEFARWPDVGHTAWAGVIDGSRAWHAVYLLSLCGLAAAGALLPDARRKLPVLALGGALTAAAVAAGWAQLP